MTRTLVDTPAAFAFLEGETIAHRGQPGYKTSARQSFNSGFWDGASDKRHAWGERTETSERPLPAWSPFYRAGYRAGFGAGADGSQPSTAWWHAFLKGQTGPSLRAMLAEETRLSAAPKAARR